MAHITKRERYHAYFTNQGWHVDVRNDDYWVLTHKDAMFHGTKLFLGKMGAVRTGSCKTNSRSIVGPMLEDALGNRENAKVEVDRGV